MASQAPLLSFVGLCEEVDSSGRASELRAPRRQKTQLIRVPFTMVLAPCLTPRRHRRTFQVAQWAQHLSTSTFNRRGPQRLCKHGGTGIRWQESSRSCVDPAEALTPSLPTRIPLRACILAVRTQRSLCTRTCRALKRSRALHTEGFQGRVVTRQARASWIHDRLVQPTMLNMLDHLCY